MIYFTKLAIRKRSVTIMAIILTVLAGIYAMINLKQELIPDIEFGTITIITVYPMASPDAVMIDVTVPVENAISGVEGLQDIQSTSAENMSLVLAQFKYGTDLSMAESAISENLNNLTFPPGVQQPRVMAIDMGMMPVLMMSLIGDMEPVELEEIANSIILPEIESVEGVFLAELSGTRKEQVSIIIDPAKLESVGLSMSQITGILKANNLSMPVGSITTENKMLPIRTTYRYGSIEEIADTIIGVSGGARQPAGMPKPILLREVAKVALTPSREYSINRTNNKPSLGIMITKDAEANTVEVANAVMEKVEKMRGDLGEGAELITLFNQSTMIERSINHLVRDALLGAICAIVVILFFLLSVRLSLIIAISIPLSILISFLLMSWRGITINMLTLSALAIAVGRLVDDSIVVLENVHRHFQRTGNLKDAAIEGTKEVIVPISAATLTTVAIFLPLALVGGLVGEMFMPFALTVTFALLASLVIAVTVVPTLSSFYMPKKKDADVHDTWYQRVYTLTLRWALRHRLITVVIAASLFIGSFALLPFIGTAFFPPATEKVLNVSIDMQPGTDMMTTSQKAAEVEGILAKMSAVESYSTTIDAGGGIMSLMRAFSGGLGGGSESNASMFVVLNQEADVEKASVALREALAPIAGESVITVSSSQAGAMETNNLQLVVAGDDYENVNKATRDIVSAIGNVEGLTDVRSDVTLPKPEIAIDVNPSAAMIFGLTTAQIAMQVNEMVAGQTVTNVELDGKPFNVFVAMEPTSVDSLEEIRGLRVGSMQPIPLSQVATVEIVNGPIEIRRIDRKRAGAITASITKTDVGAVNRLVEETIESVTLPAGVEVKTGGVMEMMGETFSNMGIALIAAIVLVYIVMVATMGSLLNPFIILFSLPLTTIGVFLSLFITRHTLGASALMGILMLIGLVLTNAIVLLSFVQQLRKQGMGVFDALVEGGRIRLRPILMTALTTIFALVPLSLGIGEEGIIAAELGTVVIGGLISSTFLTLIVIPVVYSLFESVRNRMVRSK